MILRLLVTVDIIRLPHEVHQSVGEPMFIIKPEDNLDGGSVDLGDCVMKDSMYSPHLTPGPLIEYDGV